MKQTGLCFCRIADCVDINIYLKNIYLFSFRNVYSPPICFYSEESQPGFFLFLFFCSPEIFLFWGFQLHHSFWDSKGSLDDEVIRFFKKWKNLSNLLLPSGLSFSLPASKSLLKASLYLVYFSFRSYTSFSLSSR